MARTLRQLASALIVVLSSVTAANAQAPVSPPNAGEKGLEWALRIFLEGATSQSNTGDTPTKACDNVEDLYKNALYNSYNCKSSGGGVGFALGGGATIQIPKAIPVKAGFSIEKTGSLDLTTAGTRASGNLSFSETSRIRTRMLVAYFGPVLHLAQFLDVSPQLLISRWSARQNIVDQLLAGTPQVKVNGGEKATHGKGTSLGLRVRTDLDLAFISEGLAGISAYGIFDRRSLDNYAPGDALVYPKKTAVTTYGAGLTVQLFERRVK